MNPYLEVILAAVIWGSSGAFVKYLSLPPETLSFFRMAVPAFAIAIFIRPKISKASGNMLLASVLTSLKVLFYFIAFSYTTISNAVIILYTWPVFVAIFGSVILKERLTRKDILMLAVSFSGIILVYSEHSLAVSGSDFLGMTSMLISSSLFAMTVIIFKKESGRYTNYEQIFYQNLAGALIFTLIFLARPLPTLAQSSIAVTYSVLIGILGYVLFFSALKKIDANKASILAYIEVPSAIIFGIILFGETLTLTTALGAILIIVSSMTLKKSSDN